MKGHLCCSIVLVANLVNIELLSLFETIYSYVTPILGIISACIIESKLPEKLKKIFAYIGRYTMEIYCIHQMLIKNYFHINIILGVTVSFVFCIAIPIIVSEISKKLYVSKILFGK